MRVMPCGGGGVSLHAMTGSLRQPVDPLASVQQRTVRALRSSALLVDPPTHSGPFDPARAALATVGLQRRVRSLARGAQRELLEFLSARVLQPDELRLAAVLLHCARAVERICDECAELCGLRETDAADRDEVLGVLGTTRRVATEQVYQGAEVLATHDPELIGELRGRHAELEALVQRLLRRALVTERGSIKRTGLQPAVLAGECLLQISEQVTEIGKQVVSLVDVAVPS